jgi:hypothetical protein
LVGCGKADAQGTFVYDQQSSTNDNIYQAYGTGGNLLGNQVGQSFTPGMPAVDFVRLHFVDDSPSQGLGATVYVNLRQDSMTGTILGSTDPVAFAPLFVGATNFFFTDRVSVNPGTQYFFELVEQSGGSWFAYSGPLNYPGGYAYGNGQPCFGCDLWFREGEYFVPEPSSASLFMVGGGIAAIRLLRRRHARPLDSQLVA